MYQKVVDRLNELGIPFQIVEHEPVLTTEQADRFIEGIEGVRTKTMFLTNKKKRNFYLVIMDDAKRLDMDVFKEIVEENRIKMASAETLNDKMMLPPGVVSPFGLLNNRDKDIQVYFDQEIVSEDLACSFQTAVVEVLIAKTKKAIINLGVKQLILAGGVAGNSELRKQVLELEHQLGVEVLIPKMSYCSDNAAMMGAAGYYYYKNNIFANPLTLNAKSTLDLEEVRG